MSSTSHYALGSHLGIGNPVINRVQREFEAMVERAEANPYAYGQDLSTTN